jgi:hypothetical protein
MQNYIKMIQLSRYHWQIQAPSGVVILHSVYVNDTFHAKDYAKAYISSYPGWTYKIFPFDKGAV